MTSTPQPDFLMQVTSVRLTLLVVIGMIVFAAIVICGTLWAAGKPVISWPRVKSIAATSVWVACALGVVAWVAFRSRSHVTAFTAEMMPESESSFRASALTPSRLGIRQTSSDAPEWATEPVVERAPGQQNPARIILSSQRFATLEEAERQITERATTEVRDYCRREQPEEFSGDVPVDLINKYAVKELVAEVIDQYDFGNGIKGTMYRAHLWLDAANPKLRDAVQRLWHSQSAEHRLIVLGSATGLLTLMLGAAAGYFRLDELTGGRYRGRLKLAAASLITAGGLVVATVIG